MIGTKPFFASRTIWGGLVVLMIALLRAVGFSIDDALADSVGAWVEEAALLAAAGLVLWGRIKATRRIDGTPPPVNGQHFLNCLAACCLLWLGGCSQLERLLDPDVLDADRERLRAVEPVIGEHVERHPEQAQTWRDFLDAWRGSIEARGR